MYIEEMCATTDICLCWNEIDFKKAERHVKKLQKRIALAYITHRYDVVMNLQHKMIHSLYAKALAVRCVVSNKGKYTPGIDNVVWNTSDEKVIAIFMLKRRGYKASPLRRIYIPKGNGKYRPLSIPTMHDRAMQTLYKFALEPIAEISADEHSYGFRPNRSVRDAIIHCCNILEDNSLNWILKVDIKSCFDNISHEWILEHIFMDKKILYEFLKCSYMENSITYPIEKGVPQGGPISNIICNMTLDGLEKLLCEKSNGIHMIRYADDIMVIGSCEKELVQYIVPIIEEFLHERGLELAKEKTSISHIEQGVAFLGWKLRRERGRIISTPTRKSIDSLLYKIERVLTKRYLMYEEKCFVIKPIINGWVNFYRGVTPKQTLLGVECEVVLLLNRLGHDDIVGYANILFAKQIHIYERW